MRLLLGILTGFLMGLWLVLCPGCHHAKNPPIISPTPPDVTALRTQYRNRLMSDFLDRGWPVSKKADGSPDHLGEPLLWYGPAHVSLRCEDAVVLDDTVINMVEGAEGGLERYLPIGGYAGGHEVTFDDSVGFYQGVADAVVRCGQGARWRPTFKKHLDYVATHGGELYAGTGAFSPPGFDIVPMAIGELLGLAGSPSKAGVRELEIEATAWAVGLGTDHQAHIKDPTLPEPSCYRLNLTELTFATLQQLSVGLDQEGLKAWCAATVGTDIPTVDWRCGRVPLSDWIGQFKENEYEFRFQRCGPPRELPDGQGDTTPGIDLIYAITEQYGAG